MPDRDDIHSKVDRLGDPELLVVEGVVDAVLRNVAFELLPGSWLAVPAWADAFVARLKAHHALNVEPLATLSFEAAFNAACEAAGWSVVPAPSATHRFFDTTIAMPEGEAITLSLKTTAPKKLKPLELSISKLTEAAWIQDARRQADRHEMLLEVFRKFREQTTSIIQLRCFRGEPLRYELVEIPSSIFNSVDLLTVADAQASTVRIPPGVTPAHLRIVLDRSDAKITLVGIRIEHCLVHGRWEVPNLSGVAE